MIPENILIAAEKEMADLTHGEVCIIITIHDGKPKYRITKHISIVPDKPTSGSGVK